ncbi:MAG TPA: hypothetical protein VFO38_03735 [Candidatus Saccharimonadales bacterium]|nr:hypothetical protein [Candidatus Saccharimonadales bacterium]
MQPGTEQNEAFDLHDLQEGDHIILSQDDGELHLGVQVVHPNEVIAVAIDGEETLAESSLVVVLGSWRGWNGSPFNPTFAHMTLLEGKTLLYRSNNKDSPIEFFVGSFQIIRKKRAIFTSPHWE